MSLAPSPEAVSLETVAILCRGLSKRYGSVLAVDRLDLEVAAGECFGLLGPNGAGKTTTIEVLQGLLVPDEGEVRLLGLDWQHDEDELRQRMGSQLQETKLAEKLTVYETLTLFRSFYRRGTAVDYVLEVVQLTEKRDTWVSKLSGGQRQRLAVACALVCKPDILFLDEPTTGLDPQSRRQLWEVIVQFRAAGGTALLTTHYMEEAERLCDRVAIMDRGRIIALGTPRELIASLGAEHVVEFALADGARIDDVVLGSLPGVAAVHSRDGHTRLTVAQVHETVPSLLGVLSEHGAALSGLTTHHATLEDVFLSLTGRHLRDG
jgi:ABC-2 type transport system ATP-binding protein